MKKLFSAVLVAVLAVCFTACSPFVKDDSGESDSIKADVTYKIAGIDGAPALALTQLLAETYVYEGATETAKVVPEIVAEAPTAKQGLANGTYDMAILPVNAAATFYNGGLKIKLASVNIFGCLYMIGAEDVSFEGLKGKTVGLVGESGTPDVIFRYLLGENNIKYAAYESANGNFATDTVYLKYFTTAPLLKSDLALGNVSYGILGEPVVSTFNAALNLHTVMDLQAEYGKLNPGLVFTQAGLVVNERVYSDLGFLKAFIAKLGSVKAYLDANVDTIQSTLSAGGSAVTAKYSLALIENCNLGGKKAYEIRSAIEAYLNVLKDFNAATIGGKLPDDGFYYTEDL